MTLKYDPSRFQFAQFLLVDKKGKAAEATPARFSFDFNNQGHQEYIFNRKYYSKQDWNLLQVKLFYIDPEEMPARRGSGGYGNRPRAQKPPLSAIPARNSPSCLPRPPFLSSMIRVCRRKKCGLGCITSIKTKTPAPAGIPWFTTDLSPELISGLKRRKTGLWPLAFHRKIH